MWDETQVEGWAADAVEALEETRRVVDEVRARMREPGALPAGCWYRATVALNVAADALYLAIDLVRNPE